MYSTNLSLNSPFYFPCLCAKGPPTPIPMTTPVATLALTPKTPSEWEKVVAIAKKEGQMAIAKASGRGALRADVQADWPRIKELQPGAEHGVRPGVRLTDVLQAEAREFARSILGE